MVVIKIVIFILLLPIIYYFFYYILRFLDPFHYNEWIKRNKYLKEDIKNDELPGFGEWNRNLQIKSFKIVIIIVLLGIILLIFLAT